MEAEIEEIVIVGGGIAGLATAVALKRVGLRALVLERSEELRATGAALSLFPNAWLALDALGVASKLTSLYDLSFTKGRAINVGDGRVQEVNYGGIDGSATAPRCVHRKTLVEVLAQELPPDSIRFSSRLTSIETHTQDGSPITTLTMADGTVIKTTVLIGCDGVQSVVARWLGLSAPVHSGRSAVRALAVFPQGHGLSPEPDQFLDEGKRGAFLRLNDKEVYWFFTSKASLEGEEMTGENIQREVLQKFAKDFPQNYLDVVEHTDLSTLSWAPLMFRLPWDVIFGPVCEQNITVAGDAMHPMTPELGQGGCSSLEDAVVLGRHLGNSLHRYGKLVPREVAGALQSYVRERKWRTASLITGSCLAGWAQTGGSGWLMKFFRDVIFYKFLFRRIVDVNYDCGKLPCNSSYGDLNDSIKVD